MIAAIMLLVWAYSASVIYLVLFKDAESFELD